MPKFEVQRAELPPTDGGTGAAAAGGQKDEHRNGETDGRVGVDDVTYTLPHQDSHEETKKNLYLYEEDMKQMPRVSTFLSGVLSYHTTYPTEREADEAKHQSKRAKLGTIIGVYLPTIQHIFGVLMFVRLAWIVGSMGTIESFFMVLMCCITTFVTAISMSAIATNGMVQAGGSYFMISRNLGPECGGAVGICFYLANTFATDLYILGAIEIFLQYMAPQLAYFGDIHHNPWNNFRVYGTVVVILLTLVVAVGVKFVQLFAPFSLACVIVSILSIFIGSFQANADTRNVNVCLLGERLMMLPESHDGPNATDYSDGHWCTNSTDTVLFERYCTYMNGSESYICDPYWNEHAANLQYLPGIPGMASGVIKDNLWQHYLKEDEVTPGVIGDSNRGEILADMTTTFVALTAIYFPSVTGIMTGSNMSGDLKDPQQSIPIGTILAQLTCSFVYLSFVLFFGATSHGALLRDKFGHSQGGSLLAANLCWPNHWVVLIGAFCSTIGAALQCLTSAPRLLQAIARDGIIPFLDVFKVTTKNGEPIRAIVLTALIAECGILIASLDYVAPVIDVFFLMCYGVVNLTCAIQTLLQTPNWRPRFKYYHWTLSVLGVALNLALSIIAGWYYALAAFSIAVFIYKYVEFKGGEKEWGDGITGLSMTAAQRALLKLEEGDIHTKNWRPQLLVLCKLTKELVPKYRQVISLASQLKAGKGLTVVAGVLEGEYLDHTEDIQIIKDNIKSYMEEDKVKGFSKVMVTKNVIEGLNIFVQTVGLGGLRHNTVMVGWPYGWRQSDEERSWKIFLETVRLVAASDLALLVPRNIDNFPLSMDRLEKSIDVWWIVHDGGMLLLLSFLLKQHKTWKSCPLRIFTVAQMTDNSIQLKKDLELFLYQLRINAEVFVEEMYDSDISAYTVERTLDMEKRAKILAEMKLGRRGTSEKQIQELVDYSHKDSEQGTPPPPTKRSSRTSSARRLMGLMTPKGSQADIGVTKMTPKNSHVELDSVKRMGTPKSSRPDLKSSATEIEKPAEEKGLLNIEPQNDVHFTFTPHDPSTKRLLERLHSVQSTRNEVKTEVKTEEEVTVEVEPDKTVEFALPSDDEETETQGPEKPNGHRQIKRAGSKLMRMHTAIRLNMAIRRKSEEADLVIINFPAPPANLSACENYMEYLEALTEGLDRVLMVRGSGQEVVTIYS